jgi:hypothetical protein
MEHTGGWSALDGGRNNTHCQKRRTCLTGFECGVPSINKLLGMHSKRSFQRRLYEVRWQEGRELIPPLPTAHPALGPGVIALRQCRSDSIYRQNCENA